MVPASDRFNPKRSWSKALVRAALPRCPGLYVDMIVSRLAARDAAWVDQPGRPGAMPIADMARAVIRHQLTDYDRLMAVHGLARAEARLAVADEVDDWMADWQGSAAGPPR